MKHFVLAMFIGLTSMGAKAQMPKYDYQNEDLPMETRVKDALSRMTLEEKTRLCYAQSKFSSPGVPRLGIPELYMSDGPHGVRMEINWNNWNHAGWTNDYCTAFPALTCLAATWNTELARKYGVNIGEEARYRKKSVLLGPGLNIFRTPLNGRNFEYMGEDPYLTGAMAAPYIRGLQSTGTSCCVKHYALNNQEEFRGHVDVKVSDRALHEIYLPAFRRAIIDGGAWSIMGSYNQYKDTHACHNEVLLNDILKKEWGFKGAVITDWGGAHNTKEAVFNGLDIEMGSYTNGLTTEANGFGYDDYYLGKRYLEMCRNGEVPDSIINDKAARILRLIFLTSMNSKSGYGSINSPEHVAVAREIAQEGIVLLKNEKVKANGALNGETLLPLSASKLNTIAKAANHNYDKVNILVVGENATRSLCAGGGSSELKPKDEVSPLRGLKEYYGDEANIVYAQGYASGAASYDRADKIAQELQDSLHDDAVSKAKTADVIIYIGGLNKNHFEDCEGGDRLSYNMSYNQDKLISDLVAVQPNTIVVIVSGSAVAMPWLSSVPALVQSWYLGSEAGHALADVIGGTVNPSGKTVFTYANRLEDYPSHKLGRVGYPGVRPDELPAPYDYASGVNPTSKELLANAKNLYTKGVKMDKSLTELNTSTNTRTHNGKGDETEVYGEDILVGYRWFEYMKQAVTFPFGHGLSYTTFSYGKATIAPAGDDFEITIPVTNTGDVEGKEVVQLYIGDDKASVIRPKKELKHFYKVSLKPGETKEITFTVTDHDLTYYDEEAHSWVLEPGTFKAYIGASSSDIKSIVGFKK